jgi:SAM-dependent methyltransferase
VSVHALDGRQPLRAAGQDIGEAVKDFYERYPYPPPIDDLDDYRRRWQDPRRRRADFHLFFPEKPYTAQRTILVAGCGTSQAAKHAARCPDARVVGIDVSATSVRHTEALKRKYDLSNLEVRQLPIDRVGDLQTVFDEIVCTGVLHHLADPDTALLALRNVLRPDGALYLMVYAPYGRAGIYMLQEFCRRLGIEAGDDGIRDLVAALGALPARHPLARLLREAPDFRNEAALADALLHPQDRAYSVPQLMDFINGAGLTFSRWVRQAPYSSHCGVMAALPQSPTIAALEAAQQFAAAELFRGAMMSHSVIARRDDRHQGQSAVVFSGDAWLDYVPVRVADTLCITERLPPGAAAVLINRAHTDTDIYLPIDACEKRLVEAIDGERSIGEITGDQPRDVSRILFERLWWHDQAVFDLSRRQDQRDSTDDSTDNE